MDFNDLTEEQKAKARACKSGDELAELAGKEGIELSVDELDAVSGGGTWCPGDGHCSEQVKEMPDG